MLQRLKAFCQNYRKNLITSAVVLAIGFGYYLFTQLTHLYLPCPFWKLTGYVCPGCGVTRFCISLIHLDFAAAAGHNLALAVLLPVWLTASLIRLMFRPKCLAKNGIAFRILTWGSIVLLLIFGILRNLPQFSFLLP